MVIGAYAIGASSGIVYLRSEYSYLKQYLERHLADFRAEGLLGDSVLGSDFSFDLRIQMGSGAYVCGDETALIESCEGKRGTPRVKPPYPIQEGYLGRPTSVNNVETLATITHILDRGADWFTSLGTPDSAGTRLLSVSGDCDRPGIYEVEWGITLGEVLRTVGARNARAVQVSGPSGQCASAAADAERVICYNDLSCNGSVMIFDSTRDLLPIVRNFSEFFVEESCGICVPCRAGGVALRDKMDLIIDGRAQASDLDDCRSWGALMTATSRCGLGTTAARPITTTLDSFPEDFEQLLAPTDSTILPSFDLDEAVRGHLQAHKALATTTEGNQK